LCREEDRSPVEGRDLHHETIFEREFLSRSPSFQRSAPRKKKGVVLNCLPGERESALKLVGKKGKATASKKGGNLSGEVQ